MTGGASDKSLQAYATLAGFMYLFSMAVFVAYFAIVSGFAVKGDFARTAQNIAGSESLYRIGLGLFLAGSLTIFVLGWAFYGLLKPVNPNLALLALTLRAADAAIIGVGAVFLFAALENYLGMPNDASARAVLGPAMSRGFGASFNISFVYLGVGSVLYFYLLFKSRFIPRPIAAFGMLASAFHLAQAFAQLLIPAQMSQLGMLAFAPMGIAEVGTGLWLLLVRVNLKHLKSRTDGAAQRLSVT